MTNIIELVKSISSSYGAVFLNLRCRFFGKEQQLKQLGMYGISFRPPDNSLGVALKANGYDGEVFVIADRPDINFKGLEPGELKIGNYLTGDFVYFKNDGTIVIDASSSAIINANVTVNGTVTATNFITTVADFNTHVHGGVDTGVGNTGGPA